MLMDRTFHFFHYQTATLHYSNYGKGSKALFCFHGFGLSGALFYPLEELFSPEYTIYNFDLFFHGQSKWNAGEIPIEEEFWARLIKEFCKENNISNFGLLGYSIGARPVWSIAQSIPEKVKEIIAIAPDGITNSLWFDLATGTVY